MRPDPVKMISVGGMLVALAILVLYGDSFGESWTVPDTDQSLCFDSIEVTDPPLSGDPFHGQDAQYQGTQQLYSDNGDGTVTDLVTGLMWVQEYGESMTWAEASEGASTCTVGGYNDWRLPSIRELYSLIQFSGTDPSGPDPVNLIPFIDDEYFEFEYGDTLSGARLIDVQYWSSTVYQGLTMAGDSTAFGVNFADGRIKGYAKDMAGPVAEKLVRYVRGEGYGENQFVDNGDGTVTDLATGLMWQQADDGAGRNWQEALEYAESMVLAGYDDWRLPDAHELQSIVDYTRSLQSTGSAAIDPVFSCTEITDEGGNPNYGFYWTGTTHQTSDVENSGGSAVYVCFGEALGWMMAPDSTYTLMDVHGAGAQRSDPKTGDPEQYPHGHGPQGDVVRIYNMVRCVRYTDTSGVSTGQGGEVLSLQVSGGNPASGSATLEYSSSFQTGTRLEIYDVSGRCLKSLDCFQEGSVTWSPEVTGVYLARLSSQGQSVSRVFTVVR